MPRTTTVSDNVVVGVSKVLFKLTVILILSGLSLGRLEAGFLFLARLKSAYGRQGSGPLALCKKNSHKDGKE